MTGSGMKMADGKAANRRHTKPRRLTRIRRMNWVKNPMQTRMEWSGHQRLGLLSRDTLQIQVALSAYLARHGSTHKQGRSFGRANKRVVRTRLEWAEGREPEPEEQAVWRGAGKNGRRGINSARVKIARVGAMVAKASTKKEARVAKATVVWVPTRRQAQHVEHCEFVCTIYSKFTFMC